MDRTKMTVVFEIKDPDAMKQLYDAHKSGATVCGLSPRIIAWGDQLSVPGELVYELANIDLDWPDKRELAKLVKRADAHLRGEASFA